MSRLPQVGGSAIDAALKKRRDSVHGAPKAPHSSAKRCPPPKAVRRTLSAEGAIGELARHVLSTSLQEHGCSLHGQGKFGSTATTRRVKEFIYRYIYLYINLYIGI